MYKNQSSKALLVITITSCILVSILIYIVLFTTCLNNAEKHRLQNKIVGLLGSDLGEKYDLRGLSDADVFIPERIEEIEMVNFEMNSAKTITVAENNKSYYSKNNCVLERESNKLILACVNSIIPKETTYIGAKAFYNIENSSKSVILYEGTLEDWMNLQFEAESPGYYFERVIFVNENKEKYEIEKISLPDDWTYVSDYRFCNFRSVKEIELNNVQTIGEFAFANCTLVEELYVPDTVTKIGDGAFKGLEKLEKISLPFVGLAQENEDIFGSIFYKASSSANSYVPDSIKEVIIRNEDSICTNAFRGCEKIETIELNGNIKSIGEKAFSHCPNLKKLVIPGTLEVLGWRVLNDSNDLEVYYGNTYEHFLSVYKKEQKPTNGFVCNKFYEFDNGEYKLVSDFKLDN